VSCRQQSVAQCDRRAPSEFRNTVMPTTSAPFAMVDEGRPSSMRVASMYRAAQAQLSFRCFIQHSPFAKVLTQSSLTHTLGTFCDTSSSCSRLVLDSAASTKRPKGGARRHGWFGGDLTCPANCSSLDLVTSRCLFPSRFRRAKVHQND
jgi:hypothetical protein